MSYGIYENPELVSYIPYEKKIHFRFQSLYTHVLVNQK